MFPDERLKLFIKSAVENLAVDALATSCGVGDMGIVGRVMVMFASTGTTAYNLLKNELKKIDVPKTFEEFKKRSI